MSDIDSRRMTLHVANYKVRLIMLSPQLLDLLQIFWKEEGANGHGKYRDA